MITSRFAAELNLTAKELQKLIRIWRSHWSVFGHARKKWQKTSKNFILYTYVVCWKKLIKHFLLKLNADYKTDDGNFSDSPIICPIRRR